MTKWTGCTETTPAAQKLQRGQWHCKAGLGGGVNETQLPPRQRHLRSASGLAHHSPPASHDPKRTASRPRTTLSMTYMKLPRLSPLCRSALASSPNVENVVYPPANPTARSRYSSSSPGGPPDSTLRR